MADKAPTPFNLSEKILSTITEKQMVVTYRVLGLGQIDPLTNQPVIPATHVLNADYVFYDEFEPDLNKRRKLIQNIVSTMPKKMADERVIMFDKTAEVMFANGFITVDTVKQRDLFIWLELHPGNVSNRFRGDANIAIFQRESAEKAVKETISDELLAAQAVVMVSRMGTAEKRAILESNYAGSTVNKDSEAIDLDIIALAKKKPRAIMASIKDEKTKVKMALADARTRNILIIDAQSGAVTLQGDDKALLSVAGSQEPAAAILTFFLDKKNAASLAKLNEALSYDPFAIEVE